MIKYTILMEHIYDADDQSSYGIFDTTAQAQEKMEEIIRHRLGEAEWLQEDIDDCLGFDNVTADDYNYRVFPITLPNKE